MYPCQLKTLHLRHSPPSPLAKLDGAACFFGERGRIVLSACRFEGQFILSHCIWSKGVPSLGYFTLLGIRWTSKVTELSYQKISIAYVFSPSSRRGQKTMEKEEDEEDRFLTLCSGWLAPAPKRPGVVGLRMQRNTRVRASPLQPAFAERACLLRVMGHQVGF